MTRDSLKAAMLDSLRMNRSVVLVMLAYVAFALILGRLAGFDVTLQIYRARPTLILLVIFGIAIIGAIGLQCYRHRPQSPIRFTWRLLSRDLRLVERSIIALPCMLLFPVFSSAFTSVKNAIPHLHPFGLDPLFARLDSAIHGGHAWELIHPLVGFPIVTFVLNIVYALWLIVFLAVLASAMVMTSRRELREQFLLSFFGCWILLGSAAAIGLSSVGPCFYGLVYPTDPYAPLMSYLASTHEVYPLMSQWAQEILWESYVSNSAEPGTGISAMPSLHVAVTTLTALFLARLSRTAGILGWIYLVLIVIGSVHLGWHYAIDGYVSILGALVIWRVAAWWVERGAIRAPAPVPAE